MKLIFPKDILTYNSQKLPIIPTKRNEPSNYLMIAAVKNNFDVYVCFTNQTRETVWIEKASSLLPKKHIVFEDLNRITDDKEFAFIHDFLIKEGFLQ